MPLKQAAALFKRGNLGGFVDVVFGIGCHKFFGDKTRRAIEIGNAENFNHDEDSCVG